MKKFTLILQGDEVIKKMESLNRKKGEYVSRLIKEDIYRQSSIFTPAQELWIANKIKEMMQNGL